MSYRKVKIRVGNTVNSLAIQEFLIKNGCDWGDRSKRPQFIDKPFLYVDEKGQITYSTGDTFYTGIIGYRELKFNFETITTVKAIPQRQETTVLFGKTYDKDELQAALANLTPLQ